MECSLCWNVSVAEEWVMCWQSHRYGAEVAVVVQTIDLNTSARHQ